MRWRNINHAQELLRLVSESRELTSDGGASYENFRAKHRWDSMLFTVIVDEQVSDTLKARAISEAIHSQQVLTPEKFKQAYGRHIIEARKTSKRYLIVYPLWGNTQYLERDRTIDGVAIEVRPNPSTRTFLQVQKERERQREEFSNQFLGSLDYMKGMPLIFCRLSATSPGEAFEIASNALYEYLGAVVFWDNFRRWTMHLGPKQPINRLLIAPQISAHSPTGDLAYSGFWYHDWHPKNGIPPSLSREKLQGIWKGTDRALSRVKKLPWSPKAKRALRMYFEAFSEHDSGNAFLSGWRILEIIAGDGQTRSDKLVERASKCFSDYGSAQLIGYHLKERRNTVTHFGHPHAYDGHEVGQEMKDFITPLLRIYLTNPFKFESELELWEFLDISADPSHRKRLGRILSHAEKFHSKST